MTRDPDTALMLQVQADEPGAFAELCRRFWSLVFGRFFRQLGDRQEAEDMAQEVFLRLYRARSRYQPKAKFATWLYLISQNVARNALRRRRRRPCLPLGQLTGRDTDDAFAQRYLPDRAGPPSSRLERFEDIEHVRRAVADLGDRQRQAVEMQFQNHSYDEIADHLAMSPQAAKSLLHRARMQLRERLDSFAAVG